MKAIIVNFIKIILIVPVFCLPLQAFEVRSVVIVGKTVNIDLSSVTGIRWRDLSEKRIKLLGAKVVNIYHSYGYTVAIIEKTILRGNGTLEIYLNEGKITGISIQGVESKTREEIRAFLQPETGRIFNTGSIRRRIKSIKSLVDLKEISIDPKRSHDGNIILLVNASKRKGSFYGRVGADMIYGVSPTIGYMYPGETFVFDTQAVAGIKEGETRRAEGQIEYFGTGAPGEPGLFFGVNGGKRIERWESQNLEYFRVRGAVKAGTNILSGPVKILSYLGFDYERLGDYPESDLLMQPSVTLELLYSNYSQVLNKREMFYMRIKGSGGHESINNRYFFSGSLQGSYPFFVFSTLRLLPRFLVSSISSDERCLWSYVFDNNMIGIFDDYTASKWKNVAGLDTELEISRSFVYIGPFINSAYFINEENKWDRKTGTGIMGIVYYGGLRIKIIYGWDMDESAKEGGTSFIIEGKF